MGEKVQSSRGKGEPGEGRQLVNVVAVIVTMAVCGYRYVTGRRRRRIGYDTKPRERVRWKGTREKG